MIVLLLILMSLPVSSLAATYYISPSGNDGNNGTSTGSPWKTWTKAMSSSGCGDTIMAMDGSYTVSANGSLIVTKNCSSGSVWTVQAINERKAWINNDGSNYPLRTLNASYLAFIGLRISTVDRSGSGFSTVQFRSSNNITFKRNLVQFNNRYGNTHMVEMYGASDCLVEENEVYDFHRHGIIVEGGSRNVIRRNYVNARSRDAIPGGYNGTSGDNGSGDDAFILYPGDTSIIENNIADGEFSKAFSVEAVGPATNNQWLGNINNGGDKGLEFDARGSTTAQMPNNNYAENFVSINPATGLFGPGSGREGFYSRAARGITCKNCTIMGTPSYGFLAANNNGAAVGDGTYGLTLQNTLAMNATSGGYSIPGTITSWSGTNVNAFNNSGAAYNPSSSGNWVSKFTTDPQMGACKVWRPAGSAAKTNNWGAEILYRYQNGVLTTVPLWDTVTGEFPHGAIIAGVNDIAGSSVTDIHTRLNVNTNGCPFPPGYVTGGTGGGTGGGPGGGTGGGETGGGTGGANPVTYASSQGAASTTHTHVIDASMDSLHVCVALWKSGGSVGSVSSVLSGDEALSFMGGITTGDTSTPNLQFRRVELWQRMNPTTGARIIAVTGQGTIDGMVTTSMVHDNVDTNGPIVAATDSGVSIGVTAQTGPGQTVIDCLAAGKDYTLTAGAGLTLQRLDNHATQALRLATSERDGATGGVMNYTNGNPTRWAQVAMSLIPFSAPPTNWAITLTKFRWEARGPEASPVLNGATNSPITIAPEGSARLRVEVSASVATTPPLTFALYCQRNGGGYQRVTNTYGSNTFKLFGSAFDSGIPASMTPTTQLLSLGNFMPGYVVNDEGDFPVVNPMTSVQKTEMVWNIDFLVTPNDTLNCVPRLSDGTPLTGEGGAPLPTINVVPSAAQAGF